MLKTLILISLCLSLLIACVSGTITGPSNLYQPPGYGWTTADVRAHWGIPYSTSYYGSAETWTYRRSYFVTGAYGNHIEAEYASVAFVDGKVVGVSY